MEHRQIGIHVNGEAVVGHAAGDFHADGGYLALAIRRPNAGQTVNSGGRYPKFGQAADDYLLQGADVPVGAAPSAQSDDGVSDQLPRAVVGDQPAAVCFHDIDASDG